MAETNTSTNVSVTLEANATRAINAIKKLAVELEGLKRSLERANESAEKLGNSLNKTLGAVSERANDTKRAIDNVTRATKDNERANVANQRSQNNSTQSSFLLERAVYRLGLRYINLSSVITRVFKAMNIANMLKNTVMSVVELGMNFVETENLYVQAMGTMAETGRRWVNEISSMYGLATQELMQYQATFKNIIATLGGIADDEAFKLSKTVSAMALDYASLFNFDIGVTMKKYQGALTRQVKPIRDKSGYDVTTASLQNTLLMSGINVPIKELSEMEKRLTIILALQQQLSRSGAMGDFARTIEQPANQLRILKSTLIECATWIGRLATHYLAPVMKYLVGFAMAVREVIKALAMLFGYKEVKSEYKSAGAVFNSLGDGADSATDSINNTGKAIDETKKKLAGFDDMNIIGNEASESGGSGSVPNISGGGAGITDDLLNAINSSQYGLENIKMKAQEVKEKLLDWLGVIPIFDEETGETTYNLEKFKENINSLKPIIEGVATVLGGLIIGNNILTFLGKVIGKVELFKNFLSILQNAEATKWLISFFQGAITLKTVGIAGFIIATVIALKQLWEESAVLRVAVKRAFEEIKLAGESLLKALLPSVDLVINFVRESIIPLLGQLWDIFKKVIEVIAVLVSIAIAGIARVITFLSPFIAMFVKFVTWFIIEVIAGVIRGFSDVLKGFKNLSKEIDNALALMVRSFTKFLDSSKEVFIKIGNAIYDFIQKPIEYITGLWNNFTSLITGKEIEIQAKTQVANATRSAGRYVKGNATGGFPKSGEMFIANENGNAELIGNFGGGQTGVANNIQIIEGIKQGVLEALRESNSNNNQSIKVYVGNKEVSATVIKDINDITERTGTMPLNLGGI